MTSHVLDEKPGDMCGADYGFDLFGTIPSPGTWTWLKSFTAAIPRAVVNEFKEGGCFRQFAGEAFGQAEKVAGQDAATKSAAQSGAYVGENPNESAG